MKGYTIMNNATYYTADFNRNSRAWYITTFSKNGDQISVYRSQNDTMPDLQRIYKEDDTMTSLYENNTPVFDGNTPVFDGFVALGTAVPNAAVSAAVKVGKAE